jgi:hypothetical protein
MTYIGKLPTQTAAVNQTTVPPEDPTPSNICPRGPIEHRLEPRQGWISHPPRRDPARRVATPQQRLRSPLRIHAECDVLVVA